MYRLSLAVALWALAAASGFAVLDRYGGTPGTSHAAPAQWPAASRLARSPEKPTLVVFLHARCACSRATVAELRNLLARTSTPVTVDVVFIEPGTPAELRKSSLWQSAQGLPGAALFADAAGAEAARFGAETSGHTLLYRPSGALAFSGGITESRGHLGPNAGEDRVLSLLALRQPDPASGPALASAVFGCALQAGTSGSAQQTVAQEAR